MRLVLFKKGESIDPNVLRIFLLFSSILILAITAGIFFYFFWPLARPRMDFYNELWAPVNLMVRGQSPYNTASLNAELPAAWFPMVIGFFGPLGWLAEDAALMAWFVISTLELCAIVFLSQGDARGLPVTVIAAMLAFSFPPTLYHFFLGQVTLTITLCMMLAIRFAIKGHPWSAAFCVALGLAKPHLGILATAGLGLHYYTQGGFQKAIAFYMRVIVWIAVLCLPLFLAHPNWIPDAITSMRANPYWLYPSLFIVLRRSLGSLGLFIWGLIVIAVLLLGYYLWKKLQPVPAMNWSLGLSLLITPYTGSWDFVALLPVLIATFSLVNWKRRSILLLAYLIAWYWMALIQGLESSHNLFFWWIPPWFLAFVAAVSPWKKQINRQRMPS